MHLVSETACQSLQLELVESLFAPGHTALISSVQLRKGDIVHSNSVPWLSRADADKLPPEARSSGLFVTNVHRPALGRVAMRLALPLLESSVLSKFHWLNGSDSTDLADQLVPGMVLVRPAFVQRPYKEIELSFVACHDAPACSGEIACVVLPAGSTKQGAAAKASSEPQIAVTADAPEIASIADAPETASIADAPEAMLMEDMEDDAPETPPVRKAAIHSPNTSPLPLAAEAQVEDMPVEDVPAKAAPAEAAPVQPSAESSAKDAPEPKAKGKAKAKAKAKGKLDCPSGNERKRKKLVGGLEHFFIFPHIGNNYPAVRRELRS